VIHRVLDAKLHRTSPIDEISVFAGYRLLGRHDHQEARSKSF